MTDIEFLLGDFFLFRINITEGGEGGLNLKSEHVVDLVLGKHNPRRYLTNKKGAMPSLGVAPLFTYSIYYLQRKKYKHFLKCFLKKYLRF